MKKTLLMAAATLAAGIISTQATGVYSQNIVGYVNQKLPLNAYTMLTVPLAVSSTNNAEQVFSSLNTGDSILVWNGSGYDSSVYVAAGNWIDGTSGDPVSAPLLPPGKGFLYQTGAGVDETNTFVGTVVLTNSISIAANLYTMVGSTPPIGGSIESTNFALPFQTGDSVLFWNGSGYTVSVYVAAGNWIDGATGDPISIPTLNVGQGFFYQAGAGVNEVWNQSLVIQ
jgi:hypothetical protein